jgi:hypothetical protein
MPGLRVRVPQPPRLPGPLNDGYTTGRVALTTNGQSFNLEVDTGEVTSEANNLQSQFAFNF